MKTKHKVFSSLIIILLYINILQLTRAQDLSWPATPQRGMNVGIWATSSDLATLASWGTQAVRCQLTGSAYDPIPGGDFGWTFADNGWQNLDTFIENARASNLKVIVDYHDRTKIFPTGDYSDWSGSAGAENTAKLKALWQTIATRYKDERGVIIGYDIINEPNAGETPGVSKIKKNGQEPLDGADAWNDIALEVATAIRAIDSYHNIVIESVGYGNQFYIKRLAYISEDTVPGIVYSVHLYSPHEYAEQGITIQPDWKFGADGVSGYYYPGVVELIGMYGPTKYIKKMLDREYVKRELTPILEYQITNPKARIYIGELGAIRWAPINLTSRDSTWEFLSDYVRNLYSPFTKISYSHWDWTLHGYRFSASDPYTGLEYDNVKDSTMRYSDTNKLHFYKYYLDSSNDGSAPPTFTNTLPDSFIPQTAPSVPFDISIAPADTQAYLSWVTITRAKSYTIKRSTISGGPYSPIITNLTTSGYMVNFADTGLVNGTTYYYVMTASNDYGESIDSAEVSLTPAAQGTAIIDNTDSHGIKILIAGSWQTSTSVPGYYGANYITDGNTGISGGKSVCYTPNLTAGTYNVYMRWTANSGRASNVSVDVTHLRGTTTLTVNQQEKNGEWVLLGKFLFETGNSGNVTIRNDYADGNVIADAVEFVPVELAPLVPVQLKATAGDTQVILV